MKAGINFEDLPHKYCLLKCRVCRLKLPLYALCLLLLALILAMKRCILPVCPSIFVVVLRLLSGICMVFKPNCCIVASDVKVKREWERGREYSEFAIGIWCAYGSFSFSNRQQWCGMSTHDVEASPTNTS